MSRSRLVARNVIVTLATQLISWALTFAVTLYLPRYVGDSGLGKLAFAGAFVSIFGVFVPLGTSTVLVKEIARDRSRTGELLLAAILLRIPLGLLMTGLAIGAVYALGYPALIRTLVIVAALGMIVGAINDALGSALQGQENIPRQSVAVLVEKFLSSGLMIALVFHRAPLWMLAAVSLFTGLVSLLVNLTAFKTLWKTMRLPSRQIVQAVMMAGMPFMGWAVFRTLYGQTDPVILKFMTNDATVGWYAAAFRLTGTALFIPTAITTALLPTLARLHRESPPEFQQLARRTLALVMLCGVPMALVLICLPERLIVLLHYPSGFVHSIPVLRIGGLGVLLWFAASVLGTTLIASDRQQSLFRSSIYATVLGIPACILGSYLGQRLMGNGAVGAISSDVLLEAFLIAFYLKCLPVEIFRSESAIIIGKYVLASLPMALLLTVLSHSTLGLWSVGPCVGVYMMLCWLLGCLKTRDFQMVKSLMRSKTSGVITVGNS